MSTNNLQQVKYIKSASLSDRTQEKFQGHEEDIWGEEDQRILTVAGSDEMNGYYALEANKYICDQK